MVFRTGTSAYMTIHYRESYSCSWKATAICCRPKLAALYQGVCASYLWDLHMCHYSESEEGAVKSASYIHAGLQY